MTKIQEIYDRVAEKVPGNTHGEPEMLAWLSELDGEIFETLYKQRVDPPVTDWEPYRPNRINPRETGLLVSAPYDDIYVLALKMHIHREDGEMEMADNDTAEFNHRYHQFRSAYARKHRGITGSFRYF